jgi:hypothetical protein
MVLSDSIHAVYEVVWFPTSMAPKGTTEVGTILYEVSRSDYTVIAGLQHFIDEH